MPVDQDRIIEIATASAASSYRWKDRGRAPAGYINGMAVAYAETCEALLNGDPCARAIAAAAADDSDHDVLDWYADELAAAGLTLDDDSERLLAMFVILLGLGMRESSGKHCEGRDQSATNTTAETAETGLFQFSYNSRTADPLLPLLIDQFRDSDDLLTVFQNGVQCSAKAWENWGDGPGHDFQALIKQNPKLAALYAGILLRRRRKHWGPINRKTAEVRAEAIELFREVSAA